MNRFKQVTKNHPAYTMEHSTYPVYPAQFPYPTLPICGISCRPISRCYYYTDPRTGRRKRNCDTIHSCEFYPCPRCYTSPNPFTGRMETNCF